MSESEKNDSIDKIKSLLANDLDSFPVVNKCDAEWDVGAESLSDVEVKSVHPRGKIHPPKPLSDEDRAVGWRYGLVQTTTKYGACYSVHEVYYQGEEVIENMGWTEEPVTFEADTKEEVEMMLTLALEDIKKYKVIIDNEVTGEFKLAD
jgi:hypothetical protein